VPNHSDKPETEIMIDFQAARKVNTSAPTGTTFFGQQQRGGLFDQGTLILVQKPDAGGKVENAEFGDK
jgi:hypothetical protein